MPPLVILHESNFSLFMNSRLNRDFDNTNAVPEKLLFGVMRLKCRPVNSWRKYIAETIRRDTCYPHFKMRNISIMKIKTISLNFIATANFN